MINHPHRSRKVAQAAAASDSVVESDSSTSHKDSVTESDSTTVRAPRRRPRLAPVPTHDHDYDYRCLMICVEQSRLRASELSGGYLFDTDAEGLWTIYLNLLPAERQVHNCSACRRFIEHYGGLVAIADDGSQVPAMWSGSDWPVFYTPMVMALHDVVKKAKVVGTYLDARSVWGTPMTGKWEHLSASIGNATAYKHPLLTAGQAMAAKREDYGTVATTLQHFSLEVLTQGLRLLETESLASSQKFVGPVMWLRDLQRARNATRHHQARNNILWRAIASAPDGYCHTRASVVGTLLQDIVDGVAFEAVRARFNAKVNPEDYQRPKAAPTAGNIAAAERIVEALGIKASLPRRFARMDDLETIWLPKPPKRDDRADAMAYTFAHLAPKEPAQTAQSLKAQPTVITWVKFAAAVLPRAAAMEMDVPAYGTFIAFTTAVDPAAPPILKWDRPDRRNPVAWYVHPKRSSAATWRLISGWCKVNAVALLPTLWGDQPMPFVAEGAVLVLNGAADTENVGTGLFPQHLRGELHEVRATIEAYSRAARLADAESATACGYDIRKGHRSNVSVRVLSDNIWTPYLIDRWD